MKFLIVEPSPFPPFSSFSGPNIRLRILFSNTLSLHSSLSVSDHVSQPYSTTGNTIVLYISIFKFSERSTVTIWSGLPIYTIYINKLWQNYRFGDFLFFCFQSTEEMVESVFLPTYKFYGVVLKQNGVCIYKQSAKSFNGNIKAEILTSKIELLCIQCLFYFMTTSVESFYRNRIIMSLIMCSQIKRF